MNSHVQVKCSSHQPLLHGHRAHSLLRGHSLVMIKQLQFQQGVKELRGLCHHLGVVGEAGKDGEVAVDKQADP